MNIITVEKKGLLEDFRNWGVNPDYAEFFLSKCDTEGGSVALKQFVFNDTIHLDDKIQWLLVSSAFWCRAFREAETQFTLPLVSLEHRPLWRLSGHGGAYLTNYIRCHRLTSRRCR